MDYREILKKYKAGTASLDEIKLIEAELEKYEAFEEYLAWEANNNFNETNTEAGLSDVNETKSINNAIKDRFRKNYLFTAVTVLVLLALLALIMSPVMNAIYYDPSKSDNVSESLDINYDIEAIIELNNPGIKPMSEVYVTPKGYGAYNVTFSVIDYFEFTPLWVTGDVLKDSIIWNNDLKSFGRPYRFDNPVIQTYKRIDTKEDLQNTKRRLELLSPVNYISCNLIFEKDLDMKEIKDLMNKYKKIEFIWAAIKTNYGWEDGRVLGMNLSLVSYGYPGFYNAVKDFKVFNLLDWLVSYKKSEEDVPFGYEEHFKDLLRYLCSREKEVRILENSSKSDLYKTALEYTEANGVKSFGVLVQGEVGDILNLIENESFKVIEINKTQVLKKNK
ncbi:MAG: anti sigma factor C-terminal domain-containing protein [Clostridiaceae bacterium]